MNQEIEAASTFLSTFLPPSTTTKFITSLSIILTKRYNSHWHLKDPEKGSAFRALIRSGNNSIDSSILLAATQSGLSKFELLRALSGAEGKIWLGKGWTLWIDPGCVSLRIEKNGIVSGNGNGGIGQGREGQFIEIYGKLPESLSSHAILLENVEGPIISSVNIISPPNNKFSFSQDSTTTPTFSSRDLPIPSSISPPTTNPDSSLLSPNAKRSSRAIQILRPPIAENRQSTFFSVRPTSPLSFNSTSGSELLLPSQSINSIFSSPRITPPTPARPISPSNHDVFSPSPKPTSSSSSGASNLTLSAPDSRLVHRRSTSNGSNSSVSSIGSRRASGSGSGSDAEDGIFSSSDSMSSSFTSAGTGPNGVKLWAGVNSATNKHQLNEEYRFAPLPGRMNSNFTLPNNDPFNSHQQQHHHQHQQHQQSNGQGQHQRSHSSLSNRSQNSSPSKSGSQYPRSVPSSPTKSRRRGARGGSISVTANGSSSSTLFPNSTSSHEHSSSITSISSVTSTATSSRTREQALLGVLTEHSGGKVGVLGGGVLLGLAGDKMARAHGNREKSNRNTSGGSNSSNGNNSRRRIQPVSIPFPTQGVNVGGAYGMF